MFSQISVSLLTFYLLVLSIRKQGVEIYNNCLFFPYSSVIFFTSYFSVDLLGYLGFYGPFIITK